jgi:hypothetical protein
VGFICLFIDLALFVEVWFELQQPIWDAVAQLRWPMTPAFLMPVKSRGSVE